MYKYVLSILVIIFITGGIFLFYNVVSNNNDNNKVACTLEAKICPDGTAVGRVGPNCQFAECPTSGVTTTVIGGERGYLTGKITLSPTCPVERIPPDPNCAPKPFSTILKISKGSFLLQVHTDVSGVFKVPLPPGIYNLIVSVEGIFPRCESKETTINVNSTTTTDISCDTGIR